MCRLKFSYDIGNPEESCSARAPRKTKYRGLYVFLQEMSLRNRAHRLETSLHMLPVLYVDRRNANTAKNRCANKQMGILTISSLVAIVTRYNLA